MKRKQPASYLTAALAGVLFAATVAFAGEAVDSLKQLLLQGTPQQVRLQVKALAEAGPLPVSEVLELSDLLEGRGLLSTAILLLKKQRRFHPDSTRLAQRLAQYYIQSDQSARAIPLYEELVRKDPQNRKYWLWLGELYTWNDRQTKAIEAYERAVALDSSDVETMQKLLQLYTWNDRGEDAYRLRRLVLQRQPDNLALWKEHGIQARWLKRFDEAVEAFKNILRRDPTNVEALFLLGETYLWMDRLGAAEICFRETLKLKPDHVQARFYYSQLRQWQPFGWWEAKRNYRWILARNPQHEDSRKYLALIRKEYGPKLETRGQTIHDSNNLTRTDLSLVHERYLSPRWQLRVETLYRRLKEIKPGGRFVASGEGGRLGATWYATPETRFSLAAGAVAYDGGENFVLAEAQWQQTWGGRLYTTTALKYDQVLDGVLAIKRRYTARRIGQSFYWEPSSAVHMGGQLEYSLYSDQNRKVDLYTSAEARFFSGPPSLFLEGIYAYQDMRKVYPDAVPYWTPDNYWSRSIGIDALLPLAKSRLSLRGGFAVTQQTGEEIASNWKAEFTWRPGPFGFLRLAYIDYGSRFYSYRSVQGEFWYRF